MRLRLMADIALEVPLSELIRFIPESTLFNLLVCFIFAIGKEATCARASRRSNDVELRTSYVVLVSNICLSYLFE